MPGLALGPCCGCGPTCTCAVAWQNWPNTLTLTDKYGTTTLNKLPPPNNATWRGCRQIATLGFDRCSVRPPNPQFPSPAWPAPAVTEWGCTLSQVQTVLQYEVQCSSTTEGDPPDKVRLKLAWITPGNDYFYCNDDPPYYGPDPDLTYQSYPLACCGATEAVAGLPVDCAFIGNLPQACIGTATGVAVRKLFSTVSDPTFEGTIPEVYGPDPQQITVDYPPDACRGICLTVNACFRPRPGLTVTIKGPSPSTEVVGTGTTDASGRACILVPTTGTYTYEIPPPDVGFVTTTGSVAVSGTTTNLTVGLTEHPDYRCVNCCANPVSKTLTISGPGGAVGKLKWVLVGTGEWQGCYEYPTPCCDVRDEPGCPESPREGTSVIVFRLYCTGTVAAPVWKLEKKWYYSFGTTPDHPTCAAHYDESGLDDLWCYADGSYDIDHPMTPVPTTYDHLGGFSCDPLNVSFSTTDPHNAGTVTVTE